MAGIYRDFLRILEKWPVDTTKKGRDIGEYIRQQVKVAFPAGEVFKGDEECCRKSAASLKRLSENHYGALYKRTSQSSATGLTAEQCNGVLSSEFMEMLDESNKTFLSKLFGRNKDA